MQDGESNLHLLFNETSLQGQFNSIEDFMLAIESLMSLRQIAKQYNRDIYCHRSCSYAKVTSNYSLPQAISQIDTNKYRALMSWFGKYGPYWESEQKHSSDDYFECCGTIVTDTAIGECAYLSFEEKLAQLVSLTPSCWTAYNLQVHWHKNADEYVTKSLVNHTNSTTLKLQLKNTESPLSSWEELEKRSRQRFKNLYFAEYSFKSLRGVPFVKSGAESIFDLLSVLSDFKANHTINKGRNEYGSELYQKFFTGNAAWFSDSSESELRDFKNDMTFPHPENQAEYIFAPFHGKVQTPLLRVHFSWPVTADKHLYIVYVGPKITKR